jgi:hypothetical protein
MDIPARWVRAIRDICPIGDGLGNHLIGVDHDPFA